MKVDNESCKMTPICGRRCQANGTKDMGSGIYELTYLGRRLHTQPGLDEDLDLALGELGRHAGIVNLVGRHGDDLLKGDDLKKGGW